MPLYKYNYSYECPVCGVEHNGTIAFNNITDIENHIFKCIDCGYVIDKNNDNLSIADPIINYIVTINCNPTKVCKIDLLDNDNGSYTEIKLPHKLYVNLNSSDSEYFNLKARAYNSDKSNKFEFKEWLLNNKIYSNDQDCILYYKDIKSDSTFIAKFEKKKYTVSVTSTEGGTAETSSTVVEYNDQVTLTAIPNDGYQFVNWTSNNKVISTSAEYNAIITENSEFVANFEKKKYTVSVESNNSGYGTCNINKSNVEHGDTVTLTATPCEYYRFVNWTSNDNVISSLNPYTAIITENSKFVANFENNIYTVSVESNIPEYGTCIIKKSEADSSDSTSVEVKPGDIVTLTATPNKGYQFANWTLNNNIVSTSAEYNAVITENSNFVANFDNTYSRNLDLIIEPPFYRGIPTNPDFHADTINRVKIYSNPNNVELIKTTIGVGKYSVQTGESISIKIDEQDSTYKYLFKVDNIKFNNNIIQDKDLNNIIIDNNSKITVKFIAETFKIDQIQTNNGRIDFKGINTIKITSKNFVNLKLNIIPNNGYMITGLKLNDISIDDLTNINLDSTYEYTFKLNPASSKKYLNDSNKTNLIFEPVFDKTKYDLDIIYPADSKAGNINITNANGSNIIFNNGNSKLESNTLVNLNAEVKDGYEFKGWYINGTKFSNNIKTHFYISKHSTIEAKIEKIKYKIELEIFPKNSGNIQYFSESLELDYNDSIDLIATPNEGYNFGEWLINGENISNYNEYTLTPNSFSTFKNTSSIIKVKANFRKKIYNDILSFFNNVMNNKIEPSLIYLNNSLLYDYADSPDIKNSDEIYYIKDDNTSNYIIRYDGKIKPTFIDNKNNIFYKDYIIENTLDTSIYAKYSKLKYEPLYPSIEYCAIKNIDNINYISVPNISNSNVENEISIYDNKYEYSWFNNSKCLMLNPEIKFEYNTKKSGYKNLDKVIEDKLKEYYNIKEDTAKLKYIKDLYEYTNNWEYASKDNINNYIYNITLTLKCK